ncbi:hypothetical protein D3C80_1145510 [compost metagenome]
MIETKWRTNGHYPLANLEFFRVAQLDDRQVLAFDLQQRHIGTRVGADQFGRELAAVGQAHEDLVGIGDHVVVGHHVAVSGNDEPRTQRLRLPLAIATWRTRGLWRHVALEEFANRRRQAFEVGHLPRGHTALRQLLLGTDVHHCWRSLLHQRGEIRQGFGLGSEYLAEHQHCGEQWKVGFQAWYRHTAPVATSMVKQ